MFSNAERNIRVLERFQGDPYLGFRLPRAADCRFEFSDRDYGWIVGCTASYVTPSGLLMRAHMEIDTSKLLRSELNGLQTYMQHHTLTCLRMEMQAHNAIVQPIDNSPDDRVYLSETGHRVSEAVKACATPGGKPDAEELEAACRANLYAADIVIANFNRRTS